MVGKGAETKRSYSRESAFQENARPGMVTKNHDPMLNTPFKGYLSFIQQVEVDYGEYLSSNEKTQSRMTVLVHAK